MVFAKVLLTVKHSGTPGVGSAGQKCAAEISRFTASYFQMDIHVVHCLRKIGVRSCTVVAVADGCGLLAAIM